MFGSQKCVRFPCYGSWVVLSNAPRGALKTTVLALLEDDKEEHKPSESNNSEEDSAREHNSNRLSNDDKATLEELDQLAEEWIGQDLSRWYTYRRFQAMRNKLLKQEEEDDLDTEREYEELYANLLIFGKMIGFPLVNEETGKINLYGYMIMIFFLLLPLVVVWYIGQAISSGLDWLIKHQSPF